MKIIVTGGAGFIGNHLARKLIAEKHEVTVVDSLHPYYSPERKEQHLREIQKKGEFRFEKIDLLNPEVTAKLFAEVSPEAVVHLAALPGVAYSIENPLQYIDYDIKATVNVLEAAGKAQSKQVLFASSSSVYGNQSILSAFKEEDAVGRAVSPYAASKFAAESFCHVYESMYQYQVKILRFFTVYGPWGRPDMAIASFIKKLRQGETIDIFGLGSSRDYTYIDDIINGLYLTLTQLNQSAILNLGSGKPVTMEALLRELNLHFPCMKTAMRAERAGDVHHTWADITLAKKLIGYKPETDFSTGIQKTVCWAENYAEYL
ncbi:NAD-dependent epimerase/dehydratase family protein [Mesobacillus zeae]|uniref:NAD-dependent epimerase/dehydratase family protein n=1 Tax=Mesobacillus zeae TaxID=1917180 RepID=A0A398B041_9BACI|nr:NAD-dependent epimerase/dehydratase family protein [Mesobacillus zeae]RID83207.1 NAD-dependent epimerase/dehydratase family protein [Mesobacillus zeae]